MFDGRGRDATGPDEKRPAEMSRLPGGKSIPALRLAARSHLTRHWSPVLRIRPVRI
jgi:hypothetical protein